MTANSAAALQATLREQRKSGPAGCRSVRRAITSIATVLPDKSATCSTPTNASFAVLTNIDSVPPLTPA
jgi:hypothetical protein